MYPAARTHWTLEGKCWRIFTPIEEKVKRKHNDLRLIKDWKFCPVSRKKIFLFHDRLSSFSVWFSVKKTDSSHTSVQSAQFEVGHTRQQGHIRWNNDLKKVFIRDVMSNWALTFSIWNVITLSFHPTSHCWHFCHQKRRMSRDQKCFFCMVAVTFDGQNRISSARQLGSGIFIGMPPYVRAPTQRNSHI